VIDDEDADADIDVEKKILQGDKESSLYASAYIHDDNDNIDAVVDDQSPQSGIDLSKNIEPGFINIFDKGYRVSLLAAKQGQTCLQSCFAKSDRQFERDQLLHNACVAHVRSGNERAVKIAKNSKIIGNGIPNNRFDLCLLDDIWMAWGFQVNFMYGPVL